MSVTGGLLVIGVGVVLLRGHIRGLLAAHCHVHACAQASGDASGLDHQGRHGHDHGQGHHHHLPERPGVGALLALGISGGIVPCPAALALLLAAIANGAIAAGIGLVIAFSLVRPQSGC
jgi:ABC-type nickel/cobalt efflux system permease component RcnA